MSEANVAAPAAEVVPAAVESQKSSVSENPVVDDSITPEEEQEIAGASKVEEKPQTSERVKIKVDGEEIELTSDEMKRYASLGKAAQKRMEEAAQIRKQHESLRNDVNTFLEMLQQDPAKVMKDLGMDPKKFAEELINKELEEQAKSPEQKEKEELLKKLEVAEKRAKQAEEDKKKEEFEKLQNGYAAQIEKDINDAFEGQDIPKNGYMLRKVADLLMMASVQGVDISAKDVIPLARKQVIEEFKTLSGVLPEELLEQILGDDKVAALRRRYLQKLKKTPITPKDIQSTGQSSKPVEKQPVKAKDFFRKLGSF